MPRRRPPRLFSTRSASASAALASTGSAPADAAAILQVTAQVAAAFSTLRAEALPADERRALGGGQFQGGPALVRAVAQALDSGRFPGSGGAALRAGQARGAAWGHLCAALGAMLQLARDEHLRHQGGALAEAQQVVACLRHAAAAPDAAPRLAPGAELPRRALCLGPALAILREHQGRKRRAARERRRLKAAPGPAGRELRRPPAPGAGSTAAALQRDLTALLRRGNAQAPTR